MILESPFNKTIIGNTPPPGFAINCTEPTIDMIVDKLVLTTNGYTEAEMKQIVGRALDLVSAGLGTQVMLKNGYAISIRVFVPSSIEPVYVSLKPKHPKSAFFRVELNPNKIGAEAIAELMQSWVCPVLGGDQSDFYQRARVSRIDIAIDLIGPYISELLVFSDYAVCSSKYNYNGKLETLYLGKSKSKAQTRIYDKIAEMIASGETVKSLVPVTRIERVIRNAGYLKNLSMMKNPFKTLHLGIVGKKPTGIPKYLWEMFCAYSQQHTTQAALAKLPKVLRVQMKSALKSAEPKWWNITAIWKQWPALIGNLSLTPVEHLH